MVNDKLFDKNFKSLFYYKDFTATEILSCLDKILNNYGDDIFRENSLAIINRKLSLLIEDVEYYKNSNFDYDDGIENPYESDEYMSLCSTCTKQKFKIGGINRLFSLIQLIRPLPHNLTVTILRLYHNPIFS